MADSTTTQLIGITLPVKWVKIIDTKTSVLKNRQDIIREWIEPKILELEKQECKHRRPSKKCPDTCNYKSKSVLDSEAQ